MMQIYIQEKLAQHLNLDELSESSRSQLDKLMGDPKRNMLDTSPLLGGNHPVIEEDESEYSDEERPEKINIKISKKTMVRSNTSEMEQVLNKLAKKTPEMRKIRSQNKRNSLMSVMT